MRYTEKALKADIETINEKLATSGSVYYYKLGQGSYGHTAVVIQHITDEGIKNAGATTCEIGSPKDCYNRMYQEHDSKLGKCYHVLSVKRTRKTAKAILSPFIDFSRDCVRLRQSELKMLVTWAKLTNYRKPSGACYSLGMAFYIHLQKRVKIN